MSASTVTDAASAVRASATNAAALAATTTAASIRPAASLAPRNHQRHSDAISMHPSQSACVCACTPLSAYTPPRLAPKDFEKLTLWHAFERASVVFRHGSDTSSLTGSITALETLPSRVQSSNLTHAVPQPIALHRPCAYTLACVALHFRTAICPSAPMPSVSAMCRGVRPCRPL
jgi:hypothetical protein